MGKRKKDSLQSIITEKMEDEENLPSSDEEPSQEKKKKKSKKKKKHKEIESYEEPSDIRSSLIIDDDNFGQAQKDESHPISNEHQQEEQYEEFYSPFSIDLPSIRNENINEDLISNARLHHMFPRHMPLNEVERQSAREANLYIESGKFNLTENNILKRNWNEYLNDYHIPNKSLLLGFFQKQLEDKKNIKKIYQKFARDTKLWLRLAKDLPNRTIYQIYCRARELFSDLKVGKDMDENDRQKILDLYRLHGDNYTKFCEEYGYNPKSARIIVHNSIEANGKPLKRGQWTYEEEEKLIKIVQKLMNESQAKSFDNISWSLVAKKLHRSIIGCRQKFFSKSFFTRVLIKNCLNNDWDEKFELAKLISLFKDLNYTDQSMIDWDFIKEKFSSEYFNTLLRQWRLSCIKVPDYHDKSLTEIIDFLYYKKVLKPFGNNPEKMKEIENFVNS